MAKARQKIVYIVGLSRVGSTMLDLVLGCNPRFVGLGEIFQVLRPDMNRFERNEQCSCGKQTRECPFWGGVADGLIERKSVSLEDRYRHALKVFKSLYGVDSIMVDSSKLLDALRPVARLKDVDVKVIYLIRDVRAWTISRLNNRKNSPQYFQRDGFYIKKLAYQLGWKIHLVKWILPFLTRLPIYYFILWYIQNKQIRKYLDQENIDYFSLGYDELGMNPDLMMKKIFDFLEEDIVVSDFSSVNSQSHILVGNTKKSESSRRQGIVYDNRWMYRNEWLLSAALLPKIMKYNAEEVFKNIRKASIWDK
jgi:hypothetical protein